MRPSSSLRIDRSDRPRRLPGTGALTRSRIVGSRSICWTGTAMRRLGAFASRLLDEKRHAKRFLIEVRAWPRPPAIPGEHDGGAVVQAPFLEHPRDPRNRRIGVLGVDLNEQEEPLTALRPRPRLCRVERLGCGLRRRRVDRDGERDHRCRVPAARPDGGFQAPRRATTGRPSAEAPMKRGESLREPRVATQQRARRRRRPC